MATALGHVHNAVGLQLAVFLVARLGCLPDLREMMSTVAANSDSSDTGQQIRCDKRTARSHRAQPQHYRLQTLGITASMQARRVGRPAAAPSGDFRQPLATLGTVEMLVASGQWKSNNTGSSSTHTSMNTSSGGGSTRKMTMAQTI